MTTPEQHSYIQGGWWPAWPCRICGQSKDALVHFRTLAPLIQEMRNMARGLKLGPRREIAANTLVATIARIANSYGTASEWLDRPQDTMYQMVSRIELPILLRDHYFNPFPTAGIPSDIGYCDKVMDWVRVWCALMGITSVCKVWDYGSPLQHAYNLIVLDDLTPFFFDGGPGVRVFPPQQPKYLFKSKVKLLV